MATYKVIQDIEAEDHILGPLTLRQFIYGLVAALMFYICFLVISKGIPYLLVLFLPPGALAGFFAFPFKRDQPTEVWALAKVNFLFRPRRKIWDQGGITELVTITAPKKEEKHLTKDLSNTEVQSRLQVLATMLDSRGWAVKNTAQIMPATTTSDPDRLIDLAQLPSPVPDYAETPGDDVFEDTNPLLDKFTGMINSSESQHRQQILQTMSNITSEQATVHADPIQENALLNALKESQSRSSLALANMHTLNTDGGIAPQVSTPSIPAQTPDPDTPQPQTKTPDPAILNLASNNDLMISAIANELHRNSGEDKEVIVKLH